MHQQGPDLEQRLSKLEAQLDRFSLTLQQWQQTQKHLQPVESRLSHLIEQSNDILERWTSSEQHYARTLQNELSALRQLHEEPVKELRERAASLGEICVSATSSISGLERTESRFAALESDLHLRLNELAQGLQAAVAELRTVAAQRFAPPPDAVNAWPLEDVVRLHGDLRRSVQGGDALPAADLGAVAQDRDAALRRRRELPEASVALAERLESLEQAVGVSREQVAAVSGRSERQRQMWSVAFAILALAVVGAGALAIGLQRRVDATLTEAAAKVTAAQQQAEAAAQAANQKVAATRENADRKIAEAEQTARNAQIVSDVLAAPDLVRFNVTSGATTPRAYAQMLWSRSRGLVFSGSRVPPAPAGTTYQAWLLTAAEPVSAGLFVPDEAGRVTIVTQDPPRVPRPVTGVSVTLEPTGGRPAPSGPTLLARAP
jgi:ADP-ribose pyrophosphatase YjhB (NUDIX family)